MFNSSTILSGFSKLNTFSNLITSISTLTSSRCCSYSRVGRKLFASYAVPYKFKYTSLTLSDLYSIGPCLVSNLPYVNLQNLSPKTFIKYYSTLGRAFQPDSTEVEYAQYLIS